MLVLVAAAQDDALKRLCEAVAKSSSARLERHFLCSTAIVVPWSRGRVDPRWSRRNLMMSTDTRNPRMATSRQADGHVVGDGGGDRHRQLSSDSQPEIPAPGIRRPVRGAARRHAMRLASRQVDILFGRGCAANDNEPVPPVVVPAAVLGHLVYDSPEGSADE